MRYLMRGLIVAAFLVRMAKIELRSGLRHWLLRLSMSFLLLLFAANISGLLGDSTPSGIRAVSWTNTDGLELPSKQLLRMIKA